MQNQQSIFEPQKPVDGQPTAELISAGRAAFPDFEISVLARTTSTQDRVRQVAAAGLPEGFCCVAQEQTEGRGRQDRSWVAPPGTALLCSMLLRPSETQSHRSSAIPLTAGLAIVDAVKTFDVTSSLKWPNDVLVEDRKLAGILSEQVDTPIGSAVILGMGVNLAVPSFPEDILGISLHSLVATGVTWQQFLARLLPALKLRLDSLLSGGVAAMREDWLALAVGINQPITAISGGKTITGTAVDIDVDGALLVETGKGVVRLLAGDVHLGT